MMRRVTSFSVCTRAFAQAAKKSPFGPGPSAKKAVDFPSMPCWSCDQLFNPQNELFCNGCEKLQPMLNEQSYFELFGLPVALALDLHQLEKRFQQLQKSIHPDMYVSRGDEEQAIAKGRSAAASEAYATLRNPISRAKYVLGMLGVDLESHTLDDQQLLMEIMDHQEEVEDARGDAKLLQKQAESFITEQNRALAQAQELYERHGEDALEPLTKLVIRAQYYDKLARDAQVLRAEIP